MFSERTGWAFDESAWAKAVFEAKQNRALVDLTQTNPTLCGFRFYSSVLAPLSDRANLIYDPDPAGSLAARGAVSEYYRDRVGKISLERLLLTSGTSEAYSYLLKLLVDPGESVLVPEPGYPLLDHLAQLSDVALKRYPLKYDDGAGWSIDRSAFEKLCTSDVRAIVVVHPNNPTGHWTARAEREWLEALAEKRGIALIADEVFLDFVFDSKREAESFAANRKALTFTLSGISKVLGLPQMKLSWIAVSGPDAFAQEAMKRLAVIADAYLTVSGPAQHALPKWLDDEQLERVHDEINTRVRKNRADLETALKGSRANLLKADGGWCAVLRIGRPETDEALALGLLEKGVLVQPGYLFDLPEHHLVLSLLPDPKVFQKGIALLADYLC